MRANSINWTLSIQKQLFRLVLRYQNKYKYSAEEWLRVLRSICTVIYVCMHTECDKTVFLSIDFLQNHSDILEMLTKRFGAPNIIQTVIVLIEIV